MGAPCVSKVAMRYIRTDLAVSTNSVSTLIWSAPFCVSAAVEMLQAISRTDKYFNAFNVFIKPQQ